MERFIISTVKACATVQAISSVYEQSRENTTAVSGDRITTASTAPMLTNAHMSELAASKWVLSHTPKPARIMSKGASTPPDVSEPREIAHITSFTTIRLMTAVGKNWLCNHPSITSYPTPRACGSK